MDYYLVGTYHPWWLNTGWSVLIARFQERCLILVWSKPGGLKNKCVAPAFHASQAWHAAGEKKHDISAVCQDIDESYWQYLTHEKLLSTVLTPAACERELRSAKSKTILRNEAFNHCLPLRIWRLGSIICMFLNYQVSEHVDKKKKPTGIDDWRKLGKTVALYGRLCRTILEQRMQSLRVQ